MSVIEIIAVAIGLAMDASAVSLVAASAGYADNPRAKFRLAFHFGLFQFLMPIIGWVIGINFVTYFDKFDEWIAFALLSFVGGRMVLSGIGSNPESYKKDPSRGFTLILLSIATSIDALAIGLSLALLEVAIWYPSVIIGVITSTLSLLSIYIGKKLEGKCGKRMEVVGGVVIILLGLRILCEYIFS